MAEPALVWDAQRVSGTDNEITREADLATMVLARKRGRITVDEAKETMGRAAKTTVVATLDTLAAMGALIDPAVDGVLSRKAEAERAADAARRERLARQDDFKELSSDPFRLYMREAGGAEILTREEEIALAQSIEEDRNFIVDALAQSPWLQSRFAEWREGLETGAFALRDVVETALIDFDQLPDVEDDATEADAEKTSEGADGSEAATTDTNATDDTDDQDDDENQDGDPSAACPAHVKAQKALPMVMNALVELEALAEAARPLFAGINKSVLDGRKINQANAQRLERINLEIAAWLRAIKVAPEMVRNCADQIVARHKVAQDLQTQLLRMSQKSGVKRDAFLAVAGNKLLDRRWPMKLDQDDKAWRKLIAQHGEEWEAIRAELITVCSDSGMSLDDLSRIAAQMRRGQRRLERSTEDMVRSNLRLVVAMARPYVTRTTMSIGDLVQEGNLGLITAVNKFNHRRGFKFSTYASWWIRQAITRGIIEQGRNIRVPVHVIEKITKMNRVAKRLANELSRAPSDGELAKAMEMDERTIKQMREAARDAVSLDQPVGEDGDATLADLVADEDQALPDETAEAGALRDQLGLVLSELTPREERIVRMRFGLGVGREHTLEEIGQMLGVTRERVRQIEAKALMKMKHPIRSRAIRTFLAA
ncbi:MAG: sigma-70 family RNA polymerase sigma factor [Rhodospirillaceae bacterium]|nr:sigma-70 family RNA polymerase sigma factor [Rhodospirillaceae bacterium]